MFKSDIYLLKLPRPMIVAICTAILIVVSLFLATNKPLPFVYVKFYDHNWPVNKVMGHWNHASQPLIGHFLPEQFLILCSHKVLLITNFKNP